MNTWMEWRQLEGLYRFQIKGGDLDQPELKENKRGGKYYRWKERPAFAIYLFKAKA